MTFMYRNNFMDTDSYEDIFDSLETGILYYAEDGQLFGANEMALQLFPRLKTEMAKFNDFVWFLYDHSLDYVDQNGLMRSFKSCQEATVFYEVIGSEDKKYYLVRVVQKPAKGVIVEISDISLVKLNTDDLRVLNSSNQILTEAIQTSQKGVFIAENGGAGRVIFANKVLDGLLERPDHIPLKGYSVDAFLLTYFKDDHDAIKRVIADGDKKTFWKKIEKSDGVTKWLSLNLSAESVCGDQHLVIGFICDETQTKLQENHLRQTQKLEAIGKLAGGVAHDFNNILSIVEGYVRLSESAIGRGEDITSNLAHIKRAVARGSGLTRQLLMFGKHRIADNHVADLCQQIQDMEPLLSPLLGANVRLVMHLPDRPLLARITTDSVSQIVMNLVLNARDAMPDGGEITVSLSKLATEIASQLILKISDTGTGIAEEIVDKIFDPFFTTKEQGKGTGLGLSMVYGLVQQAGGTISVMSETGCGSEFTIQLPCVENVHLSDIEKIPDGYGQGIEGKTILIAEDEPDLLVIMEETLKELGLNVLKAHNGDEALRVQDEYEGKIDFLLTDMVMPELGGLKLAELLKEVRPETHTVFMSGYPVRGDISDVELPADAIFMAKPVNPDNLRKILEKMVVGTPVHQNEATLWHN